MRDVALYAGPKLWPLAGNPPKTPSHGKEASILAGSREHAGLTFHGHAYVPGSVERVTYSL